MRLIGRGKDRRGTYHTLPGIPKHGNANSEPISYRHVHPPHLEGALRSTRGEFHLVALPGGRTRLEGRTWYEFDMLPQFYWTLWSDAMIHRIHLRVLSHIKRLSEVQGP